MKLFSILITCFAIVTNSLVAQTAGNGAGSDNSGVSANRWNRGVTVNDPNAKRSESSSGRTGTTATGTLGTTGDISTSGVGAGVGGKSRGGAILEPSGAKIERAGTITLQGVVKSEEERRQIEEQVRKVAGVNDVVNRLRVEGSDSQKTGATSR